MASGDKVSLSFPDLYNRVYVENDEPHAIYAAESQEWSTSIFS